MKNIKWFNLIMALMFTISVNAQVTTSDVLQIGKPGSSANKEIKFGAGKGNKPTIRYNPTTLALEFSTDGVDYSDVGSGSGGSGGVNMALNAEFEKTPATNNWTASAGSTATITSGANLAFDKKSVSWTPAAASDTFSNDAITILSGLFGARGEASIYYKTSSALHKLQVYDGTTVLAEKLLLASSNYKKERIEFSIPTSGTIRIRILAGDNTIIYLDKAYIGSFIGGIIKDDLDVQENFADDPKAENGGGNFTVYKDAAATSPTDGTGQISAPALTCGTTSSGPIEGSKSYLITKPASNVQGEGCSMQLKQLRPTGAPNEVNVLQVGFKYAVASGTYTDDHLKLYAYDIDNNELKELAPTFIKNSSLTEPFRGTFQTTLTGKNYRLIWHWAGTDTVANSIKIDSLRVSTELKSLGAFQTDWQTYTGGCSGSFTTNTTYTCKKKEKGDEVEFQINLSFSGAPNATNLTLNIPYTIDTTKLVSTTPDNLIFGKGSLLDAGVKGYPIHIDYVNTTSVRVIIPGTDQTHIYNNGYVTATVPFTIGASDSLSVTFKVPIVGKSSNTMLSSEYSPRKVFAQYKTTGGVTSYGSGQIIKYTSMVEDTHGAYNPATGLFICPTNDFFKVTNQFYGVGSYSYNYIGKNGSSEFTRMVQASASGFPASFTVPCKTGETIGIYNAAAGATSVDGSSFNSITIESASGSALIASDIVVAARYSTSAGQSLPNGAETITGFETKSFDTVNGASGSGTSWKWKCPRFGYVNVTASISASGSWNAGESLLISLYKQGALWSSFARNYVTGTWTGVLVANGTTKVVCNAGEELDVRTYQDSGAAISVATDGRYNYVEFGY